MALLLALVSQIAGAALGRSRAEIESAEIEREARKVFEAFRGYREAHGTYPDATADSVLGLLDGYAGNVTDLLVQRRPDGYDSPDDRAADDEFWLEMTSSADPTFRVVIADSDDAPSGAGRWLKGVYLCRAGTVTEL